MKENKTDITISTYNNIVSEYIEYFKSKDLKGNVQFQKEIDFIVSHLPYNAKILDVGTAIGDYPKYLTEKINKNFDVIGIDAAHNMIKMATTNAPKAKFKVMDARNLNFESSYFDCILCFATLIHLNDEDCLHTLDKFDNILKKGGLLVINVIEQLDKEKETFDDEPFNPKYKTYFNKYKKDFFEKYFISKDYKILKYYDNPMFNPDQIQGDIAKSNQFSIIVKKIKG